MFNSRAQMPTSQSTKGAMSTAFNRAKQTGMNMIKRGAEAVGTQMSVPMIQKFRMDLSTAMKNKPEWEKKPIEERQAIFNEVKEISKLLHLEGYRANMSRNFGFKGGKTRKHKKSKGKKGKKGKKTKRC